jgi:peptidoglycan hydrolase-like protein with peptidoglycan-binding domain
MQHLKVIIITFILTVFVTPSIASPISEAQNMLNQLGYNAGPVDGAYGNKTRRAIEQFYKSIGSSFDGKLDNNELSDLIKQMSLKGIATSTSPENKNSNPSKKAKRALAGIDIENDPKKDFFKPPQSPFPSAKLYSWGGEICGGLQILIMMAYLMLSILVQ